jgi:replicative DNA helicase
MNDKDKQIYPADVEAEAALLGSILASGSYSLQLIDEIGDKLKAEYFYDLTHQMVYKAMLELWLKQQPLDTIHVLNQVKKSFPDQLDKNEITQDYLISLIAKSSLLSSPIDTVKLIKDKYLLRTIIFLGEDLKRLGGKTNSDAGEILDTAQKKLYEASLGTIDKNFVHIGSLLQDSFEKMELLSEGNNDNSQIIPTSFTDIDKLLGGGFRKSDMVIIACRPSMGKTSFSLDLAKRAASSGNGVAYFSLEMSSDQMVERLIASTAKVDFHKIRTGNLSDDQKNEDFKNISQAIGMLADMPIWIDDTSGSSILEIRSKARRLKQRHNVGIIIIDYLQLMSGGNDKAYQGNRVQEVSDISRNLKILAKDLEVPVIALSQLSRKVDSRDDKKPVLSDLRESGSIEQDADIVMFIHRQDYYERDREKHTNKAEIVIAKNRNGQTGIAELAWLSHLACFDNLYQSKTKLRIEK